MRNADYIPRDEAPSGSTGGKKAYLDKVIWKYIPDPWEAAEALAAERWTGGSNHQSTSSPRSSRTRNLNYDQILSGRKAGLGRTASIRHSTTKRRARHCST